MCGTVRLKTGNAVSVGGVVPVKQKLGDGSDYTHDRRWMGFARSESFKRVWEGKVIPGELEIESYIEHGVTCKLPENSFVRVMVIKEPCFEYTYGDMLIVTRPPLTADEAKVHHRHPLILIRPPFQAEVGEGRAKAAAA